MDKKRFVVGWPKKDPKRDKAFESLIATFLKLPGDMRCGESIEKIEYNGPLSTISLVGCSIDTMIINGPVVNLYVCRTRINNLFVNNKNIGLMYQSDHYISKCWLLGEEISPSDLTKMLCESGSKRIM